jgi:ATP-dependent Clp protease ATP-binding subunit ClpC
VAEVLSRKYNLPLELIMESPAQRVKVLSKTLKKFIKGQDSVVEEVTDTLKRSLAGIADPDRPATAFLFVGPTGVGKTYLAKLIAKELFLKDDSIIRVDMSEFNEKHTVSRLLGSPPGYVGYGESNNFTDKIRKNPYSLILFDEIEKAHPEVFHILLQVLEDGFLTDGSGRKINFRSSIIVFTSNLGNDEFLKSLMGFSEKSGKNKVGITEKANIRKKLEDFLKPEFLNRLSNIVFFKPLTRDDLREISGLEIRKLRNRLLENKKIKLEVADEISEKLAKRSFNKREGVRLLRRLIQRKIEEPIARDILEGKILKGAKISFSIKKGKLLKNKKADWLKMAIKNLKKPALVKYQKRSVPVAASAISGSSPEVNSLLESASGGNQEI